MKIDAHDDHGKVLMWRNLKPTLLEHLNTRVHLRKQEMFVKH